MILIVCYSRSGNTEKLARIIAGRLKADLRLIEDLRPRKGLFAFIRSGFESVTEKVIKIRPLDPPVNLDDYELVLVMGPVWAGSLDSPLRSYLTEVGSELGQYAQIMTCSDPKNTYEKAFEQAAALVGKPAVFSKAICSKPAGFAEQGEALADDIVLRLET